MKVLSLVTPYHSNLLQVRLTDYLQDAVCGKVHFVDMVDERSLLADPWFASLDLQDYRGSTHEFALIAGRHKAPRS